MKPDEPASKANGRRPCGALVFLIALLAMAPFLPAERAAAAEHGMASYVAIANLYRSGRTEEAIGAVLGLARVDLAVLVGTVKAGARDIRHASPAVAAALDRLPELIMLHTEAGLSLDWKGDQDGAWQQWLDAEELAEIGPRSEAQRAFLRSWYRAFGLHCLDTYRVTDAITVLTRGRGMFPEDPDLAMGLGQAYEAGGTYPTDSPDLQMARTARDIFQEMLGSPQRDVATLRLGRVLALLGEPEAALAHLAEAARSEDRRLRYLAHLFAGDVLRRSERISEAQREFERALEATDTGQAAALSLAERLHAGGDFEGASRVLRRGLPDGPVADPRLTYSFGDRTEDRQLLEALRSSVVSKP